MFTQAVCTLCAVRTGQCTTMYAQVKVRQSHTRRLQTECSCMLCARRYLVVNQHHKGVAAAEPHSSPFDDELLSPDYHPQITLPSAVCIGRTIVVKMARLNDL